MRINLIESRNQHQWTQAKISHKADTCVRNYQYLEAGTSNGSMRLWLNLSKILEKPIDYLMKNIA